MSDIFGIGAAAGATMDLLGTMWTNDANNKTNRDNRAFQAATIKMQQDWQEYMRSTAYQATMADMKKAGLNPILAYGQGASSHGSASAASGSAIPAVKPDLGRAAEAGARILNSAATAREQVNTMQTTQAQQRTQADVNTATVDQRRAETRLTDARTLSELGVPAEQAARILAHRAGADQSTAAAALSRANIPVAGSQTQLNSAHAHQVMQAIENIDRYGMNTNTMQGLLSAMERALGRAQGALGGAAQQFQRWYEHPNRPGNRSRGTP